LTIGVTVTSQVATLPLWAVAVILAVPDFKPLISPAVDTLAIVGALDVQVMVLFVALVGSNVTDSWKVVPFAIDFVEAFKVIDATGLRML
jgi:hypothetical protein